MQFDHTTAPGTDITMHIALFVTCLVDLFRPSVGHATVTLLERSGGTVSIPRGQVCCGQPAYNNGDRSTAQAIARQVIDEFEGYEYVVVPSGSCAGMIIRHYPQLLADDNQYAEKANQLANRCFELSRFLVDVADVTMSGVTFSEKVTYHDSCSCLRELNIKAQPRQLLRAVNGLELAEMQGTEECCGFGGTFCVKYEALSVNILDNKVNNIEQSGADVVLAADMGCLMNIAGRIKRSGMDIRVYHIAEVLAGMVHDNGIGGK